MARIESAFFDIGSLDLLARQASTVHGLDARAKLLTTAVFIVTVVSFGKYEVSALLPFFLFPVAMIALADLPPIFLLKKLLLVAPFAFFIGAFNPWFDQQTLLRLGTVEISGGWVSFLSILLRFALTAGAALILIATTGFNALCMAMERLGTPRIFVLQLLFLHRYLFVLAEEALRLVRARALRSFQGRGTGIGIYGQLAGQLLLRTLDRAQRIHLAMLCRGFDGEIRLLRPMRFGRAEVAFTLGWSALFLTFRLINLPLWLGHVLAEFSR
jgi:cobalt/nickel transport system permease protein